MMQRIAFLLLLPLLVSLSAVAQTDPNWDWISRSAGTTDTSTVHASVSDSQGNVYVVGLLLGTATTFGTTTIYKQGRGVESYIAKLSPTGQWLWALAVGSPGPQPPAFVDFKAHGIRVWSVTVDAADNVYIGGQYDDTLQLGAATLLPVVNTYWNVVQTNGFVASLTPQGQWRWAQALNREPNAMGTGGVTAVGVNPVTCEVVAAGWFFFSSTFGATQLMSVMGGDQGFLATLTPQGQWAGVEKIESVSESDLRVTNLAFDAGGNAHVLGSFSDSLALGGHSVTVPPQAASSGSGYFIAKYTPQHQWAWLAKLETAFGCFLPTSTLTVDAGGHVYVGGGFITQLKIGSTTLQAGSASYVAALSPQGQWQWVRHAPLATTGLADNQVWALVVEPATGDVLVAGSVQAPTAFDAQTPVGMQQENAYVTRFSAAGAGRWSISGRGATPTALALAPGGTVYVAAVQWLTLVFGTYTMPMSAPNGWQTVVTHLKQPAVLGTAPATLPAQLALTPNPSVGGPVQVSGVRGPVLVRDLTGRVVATLAASATGTATLRTEGLAKGVYVVQANGVAQRLVIE